MAGVTYLNNRTSDPATGVFTSVDPLVSISGDAYLYGGANPTTLSDPTGLLNELGGGGGGGTKPKPPKPTKPPSDDDPAVEPTPGSSGPLEPIEDWRVHQDINDDGFYSRRHRFVDGEWNPDYSSPSYDSRGGEDFLAPYWDYYCVELGADCYAMSAMVTGFDDVVTDVLPDTPIEVSFGAWVLSLANKSPLGTAAISGAVAGWETAGYVRGTNTEVRSIDLRIMTYGRSGAVLTVDDIDLTLDPVNRPISSEFDGDVLFWSRVAIGGSG